MNPLVRMTRTTDAWLFPPACHACCRRLSDTEQFLCTTCQTQARNTPDDMCPRCAQPHPPGAGNHLCSHCLSTPPSFVWLRAAGTYHGLLADLLQQFKFHHKISLAAPLAHLFLTHNDVAIKQFSPTLIVPTPLHRQRLRERGYNQAQLIGQQIGKRLNIPVKTDLLTRVKPTKPQSTLTLSQRALNTQGAFLCQTTREPTRILLIDDIATTTSTVRSCSNALSQQGHQVAVAVIARAALNDQQSIE